MNWCLCRYKIRVQPNPLHVDMQFTQHDLLKDTSLSQLCICGMLDQDQLTVHMWACYWTACSVPLVHTTIFMLVPYNFDNCSHAIYFEIKNQYLWFCSFLELIWLLEVFCDSIQSVRIIFFSISVEKIPFGFDRDCLRSFNYFG